MDFLVHACHTRIIIEISTYIIELTEGYVKCVLACACVSDYKKVWIIEVLTS